MIQKRIYELGEKEWTITRKDLTKGIFGKPLIPEKWIIEQGGAEGGILMKLDLDNQE